MTETWILEQRAESGALWLDMMVPHWHRLIDTEKLDVASRWDCVLGQIYDREHKSNPDVYPSGYDVAVMMFRATESDRDEYETLVRLGFTDAEWETCRALTIPWLKEIKDRMPV